MAESVTWSTSFTVLLGPRVVQSGTLTVDAYDKISVQLDAGAADVNVDVQPSVTVGDVRLLVITASSYEAGVSYSADGGTTTTVLDGPLALIGAGAITLLANPPQVLQFDNPGADPVSVDILVGRSA